MGKLKVCVHIYIHIYIHTYIYIYNIYIYIEYFKHVIYTWISMCGKKSPLPDSQRVCSGGGFADFAEVTGAFHTTEDETLWHGDLAKATPSKLFMMLVDYSKAWTLTFDVFFFFKHVKNMFFTC